MLTEKDVNKSERWILSAHSVTKYNPIYRDEQGVYLRDEWTDYSDIEKKFEGNKLTLEEYENIETKYVESVKYLFRYYRINKIQLISKKYFLDENLERFKNKELGDFYMKMVAKRTVGINDIDKVVRLILRGGLYCELWGKNNRSVVVRFGYDYYMHFNCPDINDVKGYIENELGLFVQ